MYAMGREGFERQVAAAMAGQVPPGEIVDARDESAVRVACPDCWDRALG
jgi:hypothetical protein